MSAVKQWLPDVPLRDCAESDIMYATQLQRALLPYLRSHHEKGVRLSELEGDGIVAHQAAFALGKPITGRYWHILFNRVWERDNRAGNWERLEIFLPKNQTRRASPATVTEAIGKDFPDLAAAITGCDDPMRPDLREQENIERRTRESIELLMDCGRSRKSAMREVCGVLAQSAPFVNKSRDAIRCLVSRWLGERIVGDRRRDNGGSYDDYKFPPTDARTLLDCAVWQCNGRVREAWRQLWALKKFTPETMTHYGRHRRGHKSEVPKAVMIDVRWWVEMLNQWRLGKGGYNANRAMIEVDHSITVPPMLIMTADDLTPDFRYGVEIEPASAESKGRDMMVRGQIMLLVDVGTLRILGWVRTPLPSYNAPMILGELTRICKEIAVPAGIEWERGIWESATLLKGRKARRPHLNESATSRECRLERLGIKFKHAISPQGKAIMERTVRFFQEGLAPVCGWTGNDEAVTCPDESKRLFERMNSGQMRACEAGFHTEDTVDGLIRDICLAYNARRQHGEILNGISPDEAWAKFPSLDYLPTKFTPELEHMLTYDEVECKVTVNGVRPYDNGPIFWSDQLLSRELVGQPVRVRADVLDWSALGALKSVIVSDLDDEFVITCHAKTKVGRADWILDPDCGRLAQARRENAALEKPLKEMLRDIKPKSRFHVLPQPKPLAVRLTVTNDPAHLNAGRVIGDARDESSRAASAQPTSASRLTSLLHSMPHDSGAVGRLIHQANERAEDDMRLQKKIQEEANRPRTPEERAAELRETEEFERINNAKYS